MLSHCNEEKLGPFTNTLLITSHALEALPLTTISYFRKLTILQAFPIPLAPVSFQSDRFNSLTD